MNWILFGSAAGGIGLFLLGMQMMTQGLKLAAGPLLRDILTRSTRTSLRGLVSGALITALVQSSSAATVATIGFVNAGLMRLRQAVTVIYGTNIGTTMTGWLVATIGFHVNIKAFALPAIGLGMLLKTVGGEKRRAHLGEAVCGFGLFFIGLDILKNSLGTLGSTINLEALAPWGPLGILLFVGTGFFLTVVMQSSSAAIAVILTSAGGGALPMLTAAAMVIGANIGTTSTAVLAVIGATPNAKRVAAAHIAFNVITGATALLVMPWLLLGIETLQSLAALDNQPATVLALFHSTFNMLGVALLWPLTSQLVHFLEKRFRSSEEDLARPQFLDTTVAGTPVLALLALTEELTRIGCIARQMAHYALTGRHNAIHRLEKDKIALDRLVDASGEFINLMQRSDLPPEVSNCLPNALRVSRYYTEMSELALAISRVPQVKPPPLPAPLPFLAHRFHALLLELIELAATQKENFSTMAQTEKLNEVQKAYQKLKSAWLRAGAAGEISVRPMVDQLDIFSNERRMAEQTDKAARYLSELLDKARAVPTR